MYVKHHAAGMVSCDCLWVCGGIFQKLYQLLWRILCDFSCSDAILFIVTRIFGSTVCV